MSNFDSLTDYSKLILDTPLYKSKFPNFAKYINEKNLNVLIFQSHDKYNVSVIDSNQLSNLSKFYKFARIKGYQLNQLKKLILTIFPTSTTSNKSLLDCFTTLDAKYNFSENK